MSDEPSISTMLERQILTLERTVNDRFDRQDRELAEIKQQTTKTNGRVTILENARAHAQGVLVAFRWLPALLASACTAGLTILIMALSGGLH